MNTLMLTGHAAVRMAQRGIKIKDADLITLIGTEVDDGYLVRDQDCQNAERELKQIIENIRHVRGKRLVVANGQIVTAYHTSRKCKRRLLRNAHERDLSE